MKKALSFIMACAMTAALLAGCSSASGSSATEAATTVESTIAETAKETSAEETTAEETTPEVSQEAPGASVTLRVGSLKGPTTMGLVSLMDKSSKGESKGSYEFTLAAAADELVGKIVSGDLDIALVPANMASILYKKTNKGIQVLDINTLGVLYVVAADDSIQEITDLAGKTVYMTGKGTTPDYVFNYLLTANGLSADDVTIEYKSEAAEVAAVLKEQPDAIGLLPQPFVTVAMAQNETLNMVLDLTEEWDKLQTEDGGSLVTGVTVCRSALFDDAPSANAVRLFMEEHKESAAFANDHIDETAELVASTGIIEKAPVAKKALPYCSITYVDGNDMKEMLTGYLKVLYDQDPTSVGGELPDESFFYTP